MFDKTLIASVTFRTRYVVDKVNISSVKSGNEMAQVNWKAVKDVSGYEIYRSTNAKRAINSLSFNFLISSYFIIIRFNP